MADGPLNILRYSSYSKKAIQAFYPFQLVSISPLLQITVINYAPIAKPPCKEDSSSGTAAKEGLLDFFVGKRKRYPTLKGSFSFGERSSQLVFIRTEAFKRQHWGRGGTFGLEEKHVLLSPWTGRSGLHGLQPNGMRIKKLCFDFPLAGDGSWAGAGVQELAAAVALAQTGHSYRIGDE